MQELLNQFNKEYDFLYEHGDNVAGYNEAVNWFDENRTKLPVVLVYSDFIKERGDICTSDREAAAFAFAYEALGL